MIIDITDFDNIVINTIATIDSENERAANTVTIENGANNTAILVIGKSVSIIGIIDNGDNEKTNVIDNSVIVIAIIDNGRKSVTAIAIIGNDISNAIIVFGNSVSIFQYCK